MIKFRKESNEVLYNTTKLPLLNKTQYDFLKKLAKKNKKKIIRLCVHKSKKELIHQMFIVHPKNYYVQPHFHNREESMLILSGKVDVIIFDRKGNKKKIINMGDFNSGKIFYYKLPKNTLHTLIIRSKILFFLEITRGPFQKSNMTKLKIKKF